MDPSDSRVARRRFTVRGSPRAVGRLTLLARAYCGLCDAMHAAVAPLASVHGVEVEVIDVDSHPAWAKRWGDLVPVLFLGSPDAGHALCHYHADLPAVEQALAAMARETEIR